MAVYTTNPGNALLGVGHSATWDASIVESVTPAVIDDNW